MLGGEGAGAARSSHCSAALGLAPSEFGWFGYSPRAATTPGFYVVTSRDVWGAAAALGLATIAAAAGYVMGARRTPRGAPTAD